MAEELILIVEDDDASRLLLRDALQAIGYRTLETATGEEAVTLARANRPALILMDIQLPGISGTQALRQIRQDPDCRAIPVIAVTASVMSAQQTEVLGAGFDAFEAKPISVMALLDTVRRWIDTSK